MIPKGTEMKLSIGELIMIHRTRKGISKKELAKQAFPDLSAPGIKLKKIEQGMQDPTQEEIARIANILGLDENDLHDPQMFCNATKDGIFVSEKTLKHMSRIGDYLRLISSMAELGKDNLIKTTIETMCNDNELLKP